MPFSSANHFAPRNHWQADLIAEFNLRLGESEVSHFLCEVSGDVLVANRAAAEILGSGDADLTGFGWLDAIHPDDRFAAIAAMRCNGDSVECRFRSFAGGHPRHIHLTAHRAFGQPGPVMVCTLTDSTPQFNQIADLREREVFMNTVTAALHEGVVVHNVDGEIVHCNPAAERILGASSQDMVGKKCVDPDFKAIHADGSPFPGEDHPTMVALRENRSVGDEILGIGSGDNFKWLLVNASPLRHHGGEGLFGVVATFVDITNRQMYESKIQAQLTQLNETHIELEMQKEELQQLNSKLRFQAETDALTLVYNRGAIMIRLDELVRKDRSLNYGVILLDIDHFKSINDSLGHHGGDQILQLIASLLSEYTPNGAAIGRYGGEEFLIVVSSCTPKALKSLAEEIRSYIEYVTDGPTTFTASFGVAHASQVSNPADLTRCADHALYESKNNGRNRVTLFQHQPD